MANSQLTAYASAQLDKGVSREAITQALVGAGWMQADVDEAVAEVMSQRAGAASPVAAATSPATAVAQPAMTPASEPATSAFAATAPLTPSTPATSPVAAASSSPVTPASFFATTPTSMTMDASATAPKKSLTWLFVVVGIVLALGIIGGAAYAFLGGAEGASLPVATADELATVQQERDQLRGQVTALTDAQKEIESELALFLPSDQASVTHTVAGRVSTTTAGAWTLTTKHGIVVTLSNGREPAVLAVLAPLKEADATISGTHAPGSTLLKVIAVNGTAIAAATSTTPAGATAPGTR